MWTTYRRVTTRCRDPMPVSADGTSRSAEPEGKDLVVAGQGLEGPFRGPFRRLRPAGRGLSGRVLWAIVGALEGLPRPRPVRHTPAQGLSGGGRWTRRVIHSVVLRAVVCAAVSVRWGHGDKVRPDPGGRLVGRARPPGRMRRRRLSPVRQRTLRYDEPYQLRRPDEHRTDAHRFVRDADDVLFHH